MTSNNQPWISMIDPDSAASCMYAHSRGVGIKPLAVEGECAWVTVAMYNIGGVIYMSDVDVDVGCGWFWMWMWFWMCMS